MLFHTFSAPPSVQSSVSPILRLAVQTEPPAPPPLPDGAFDTRPDRAFAPLSPHVVPVQPGVGYLVLGLRLAPRPVRGARHHRGQRAALRLVLHHVELLLVGQLLVDLLPVRRRKASDVKRFRHLNSFSKSPFIWVLKTLPLGRQDLT